MRPAKQSEAKTNGAAMGDDKQSAIRANEWPGDSK
jgi:hypothetical protein